MATIKLTPSQKNMLESMANGALLIPHSYNKMVVMSLVKKNLIQATKTYSVGSDYELTDAGRAALGIEPLPPMVDQPQPAPEVDNDDLPFSDVGKEDTQEVPTVIDDTTPTLSNIIDAALDPDNQAAYEALKVYDFASTPLWALKIERDDVNAYKWQIWHELRKMPYGVMGSNPDYAAKQLEVDRAFNVMAILNDAIYSYHKGVGFNVLD